MKALFLDRDGTVNVDYGYVHEWSKFEFVEGVMEFCRRAQGHGYSIFVVTNQSGIARGMFTEREYQSLTRRMKREFARNGVKITAVYHCPDLDGPDRKPAPGLFLKARRRYGIDMKRSVSIGDKPRDVEAGKAAGVGRNVLLDVSRQNPFRGIRI